MDAMVKKVAALGVPGLVFMAAIEFTGLSGAAALTTALAALGPGGIIGGVMSLCIISTLTDSIAEYGFDKIAEAVMSELYKKGESKESLKNKIAKYPITKKLKNNLYNVVDSFS